MVSILLRMPESRPLSGRMVMPPVSAAPRSSAMRARPYPLWSPIGVMAPVGSANMTAGSVVGRPALSIRSPSSIRRPSFMATRTLPSATLLVAKSRTIAGLSPCCGYGNADRVGQEPGVGAAKRRDSRGVAADIDELDRDHTGVGADFAIGADPSDMMRQDQSAHRHAGFPCPLDGAPCDLQRCNLAVPAPGVAQQERSVVAQGLQRPVDGELAGLPVADIGRHHADAVAVMALQVRLDQMVGHGLRLAVAAAHCGEHGFDGDFEAGVRHGRHGRTLTHFTERNDRPRRRQQRWPNSPAF